MSAEGSEWTRTKESQCPNKETPHRGHVWVQAGQIPKQAAGKAERLGLGCSQCLGNLDSRQSLGNQTGFMSHNWAASRKQG